MSPTKKDLSSMSIKRFALIGLGAVIVLAGIGFVAFNLLTTNNTAPSSALTAIPVTISTATPLATTAAASVSANATTATPAGVRSEERRVGKECRSRWA